MKKITLIAIAGLFASSVSFAQVKLSNNVDENVTASNSVGCPNDNDNNWGRNFDLSEYTIPANFGITEGQVGVQSLTADAPVTINVYSSTVPFDETQLVLLGTQEIVIDAASTTVPGIFEFTFDIPVLVPANTPAIFMEASLLGATGSGYFMGGTAMSLPGKESFLKSVGCAVPDYVTASSIGFPDAHFFMTLTGETILGVNDEALSLVSVYPSPATDVLNVRLPSNVEVQSSALVSILGKTTGATLSNGVMNVSGIAPGVYFLNLETNKGTYTQKVIKQ